MAIGSVWAEVPIVRGSDEYGVGADYITAKVNTEQNEALQSRDIFLLNKFREYYDKTHIDNLLSKYTTNLDWKESLDTYDDILDKYPVDIAWKEDVDTYSDIFKTYPEPNDGDVVNVKDIRDIYYFAYIKPSESEDIQWLQINPYDYNNHIVEELQVYTYIYLNGYWQELNPDLFSQEEKELFVRQPSVRSYNKISESYPEPEDYWVVDVVDPNSDFLYKGQIDYYENLNTVFPNPEERWLVEVVNPNENCTYRYNSEHGIWERLGQKFKPEDGWVVNVKDTNYTYRYDAPEDKWIAISANAIPLASEEVDGLMSKEDYAYLRQIESEILPTIYLTINQIEEKMFPLGTIVPYAFNTVTPPPGFVFAEGIELNRLEYPDMWEKLYKAPTDDDPGYDHTVDDSVRDQYPGRFTNGDGITTFRTPNLKGLFLRGLDIEGLYDSYEREFGTFQNDSIAEHSFEVEVTGVGSIDEANFEDRQLVIAGTTRNQFSESGLINLYTSSDAETRPKNVALRFIVKVIPSEKLPTITTDNTPPELERPIDADTLNGHPSSITAQAGYIPVAESNGKIDSSWFDLNEIVGENYVRRNEVAPLPLSNQSNMIPRSNNANNLDDWISLITEEDVDRWIGYLNNDSYDISLESYNDRTDIKKKFVSEKKFRKFLIELKEFITTFKQSYTTEEITPTNERGYISNAERIKYSDKYTKNETYELLYNFLNSYIPLADASISPAAGKIPIAGEDGKLDSGWMSDLFLNKIGTDDTTGYAEVNGSRDIHIRGGIVDNTLTGNINLQGGGVYSISEISPAKTIISGYDGVENKGGNVEIYAGAGGSNISSIGGSVIIQSGTGSAYNGTIDLNNIKISKNNTIYTNELNLKLQQNDGINNTNYLELTNAGLSYKHDNLVNDNDDFTFTLNNDGSVTTNKPNVPNGITKLNFRALVPFENLPKTVIINNIGDFLSAQTINTDLGNFIVGNVGQSTTLTIEDNPYLSEARELTFVLTMRGQYNINWPINVNWLSGNKPALDFGETAIIKLLRIANGEWLGWKVGDAVNASEYTREIGLDHNEMPLDDFEGVLHKYVSHTYWAPGQEPPKEDSSCIIVVDNAVEVGGDVPITIKIPRDAYGTINVNIINNNNIEVYNETLTNLERDNVINIPNLSLGTYTVTAEYSGNEYYNSSSDTTTFEVTKATPSITINVQESAYTGSTVPIEVIFSPVPTGRASISLEDEQNIGSSYLNTRIPDTGIITFDSSARWPGNNKVVVVYEGDTDYNSVRAEQPVLVEKDPEKTDAHMTVVANDIVVGSATDIKASFDEGTTGSISYKVFNPEGRFAYGNANIVNGVATVSVTGLGVGEHHSLVMFSDSNYAPDWSYDAFNILPAISIESIEIMYTKNPPNDTTPDPSWSTSIKSNINRTGYTGGITLSLTNTDTNQTTNYYYAVLNEKNYTVHNINVNPGEYILTLKMYDNILNSAYGTPVVSTYTETITIEYPSSNPDFESFAVITAPDEITEGEDLNITVTVPEDTTNYTIIRVTDTSTNTNIYSEYVRPVEGIASVTVSDIPVGNYRIIATYIGDENYYATVPASTKNVVVTQSTGTPDEPTPDEPNPGDNPDTPTPDTPTPDDPNDPNQGNDDVDPTTPDDPTPDNPTQDDPTTPVVKVAPNLSVSSSNIDVGETVTVFVTLNEDATGSVGLYMPSDSETPIDNAMLTNGTASFEIPDLAAGTYSFKIGYFGDSKYSNAEYSSSVTVSKYPSFCTVTARDTYSMDYINVVVEVPADADPTTSSVTLTITDPDNSIVYSRTSAPENGSITFSGLLDYYNLGTFTATAIFNDSYKYESSTGTTTFLVSHDDERD